MHILFRQARQIRIPDIARNVKVSSTLWIRQRDANLPGFAWQTGYWAGSVSRSHLESVRRYIRNQAEHHRKASFLDEYIDLLKASGETFDPRYPPE